MVDLHMHSTFSDGTMTPTELVERALKKGTKVMAITDHDNIDGLKEGSKRAKELGIEFINGIEISANFNGKDVHILGYFLDLEDKELLDWLSKLQEKRYNRTLEILKKLSNIGMKININELEKEAKGNVIGRPHIARVMLKKGFVESMNDAFDRYLGDNKPAYMPKLGVDILDVVKILNKNKAVISLAHPHLISHLDDTVLNIIDMLKESGLDGLELEYPNIDLKKKKKFVKIAKKRDLIITGGSDFHGLNRSGSDLDMLNIPMKIFDDLKKIKTKK